MARTRRAAYLAVCVLCVSARAASAGVVSVDLSVDPAADPMNVLQITVAASYNNINADDSDETRATGNVLADLNIDFDPASHEVTDVTEMTFTGGLVSLSDMSFRLSFGLFGNVNADSNGIRATFATPLPPAAVGGGEFNTLDHEVLFNQGTFDAAGTGLVGGLFDPTTIDLAAEPLIATSPGTGMIDVALSGIEGQLATYDVTLTQPMAFDEVALEDGGIIVTITGEGTFQATGQFTRTVGPLILTWDGQGDGLWSSATQWTGGAAGATPDGTVGAIVETNTVTVAADAAAYSLSVAQNGAVAIESGNLLDVPHDVQVTEGTLAVDGDAVLQVAGAMTLEDAQYVARFGPAAPGQASLADGLQLIGNNEILLEATGSLPSVGETTHTLLDATGGSAISGAFTEVPQDGDHLGFGVFHVKLSQDASAVTATLFQAVAGDTDGNRDVNGFDIQAILAANKFGTPQPADWTEGDFTADHVVNGFDIQAILAANQFGQGPYAATNAPGTGPTPVPEPGTLWLALAACLGLAFFSLRRITRQG